MSKIKSVRLSTYLREQILESVMVEFTTNFLSQAELNTTKQLDQAIKDEGLSIALKLWGRCYGKINFTQTPNWSLSKANQFTVAQEDDTSKTFAAYVYWSQERAEANRRPCKSAIDLLITKPEWEGIFNRTDTLGKLKEAHNKEYNGLRSEVKPVLDSFNTTKQLLETWPSMEKFLPPNIADPDKGINLPALALSRLDAKINGN